MTIYFTDIDRVERTIRVAYLGKIWLPNKEVPGENKEFTITDFLLHSSDEYLD